MKTITLIAYNRPHYLKRMLESLSRNNLEGYHLYCGVEPNCQEVIDICKAIDFVPCMVHVNAVQMGITANALGVLDRAFDAGSEFNVYLEDDLLLAPDTLDLANWYATHPRQPECVLLNLCNCVEETPDKSGVKVINTTGFNSWGWVATRESWHKWIRPNWFNDYNEVLGMQWGHGCWDWSINGFIRSNHLNVMRPTCCRVTNIGEVGTWNFTAEHVTQHKETFGKVVLSDGSDRNYHIVE